MSRSASTTLFADQALLYRLGVNRWRYVSSSRRRDLAVNPAVADGLLEGLVVGEVRGPGRCFLYFLSPGPTRPPAWRRGWHRATCATQPGQGRAARAARSHHSQLASWLRRPAHRRRPWRNVWRPCRRLPSASSSRWWPSCSTGTWPPLVSGSHTSWCRGTALLRSSRASRGTRPWGQGCLRASAAPSSSTCSPRTTSRTTPLRSRRLSGSTAHGVNGCGAGQQRRAATPSSCATG